MRPALTVNLVAALGLSAATFFLVGCGSEQPSPPREVAPKKLTGPPPVIEGVSITPERPTQRRDLRAKVRLSGPPGSDGRRLAYQWLKNGSPIEGATDKILPSSNLQKGDEIVVRVLVADTQGRGKVTESDSVRVLNSTPRTVTAWITPVRVTKGEAVEAHAKALDVDGDEISFRYQWMRNGEDVLEATSSKFSLKEMARGDRISVRVTPYDGEAEGVPSRSSPIEILNAPPEITSKPPERVTGETYSYPVIARDPDGDPISFRLVKAPAGMTVDEKGLVTWALSAKVTGTHKVEVLATDADGGKATQRFTVTVAVTEKKGKKP